MTDPIFSSPKLVEIYDSFDGKRNDLIVYQNILNELKVKSVLDVGCGTGCLALLLSQNGFSVIATDPANASVDAAKKKKGADKVEWHYGDSTTIPPTQVDAAVMTGNVAQVFITDDAWLKNLKSIKNHLKSNGYLIFETRNPDKKAWLNWTPEKTYSRIYIDDIGYVNGRCQVLAVNQNTVNFRWTYEFETEQKTYTSDSTLIFRTHKEIQQSLEASGFRLIETRDAPDRPGLEFVFIAQATN